MLIPSLLLQPLLENSIKYAIAGRAEGGTVSIEAKVFADEPLLQGQGEAFFRAAIVC